MFDLLQLHFLLLQSLKLLVIVSLHFINPGAPLQGEAVRILQVPDSSRLRFEQAKKGDQSGAESVDRSKDTACVTHRVNEEIFEVFMFGFHLGGPRNLALSNHFLLVHIVQVRPGGQQKHASSGEQTFALVYETIFENQVAVHESVPFGFFFLPCQS